MFARQTGWAHLPPQGRIPRTVIAESVVPPPRLQLRVERFRLVPTCLRAIFGSALAFPGLTPQRGEVLAFVSEGDTSCAGTAPVASKFLAVARGASAGGASFCGGARGDGLDGGEGHVYMFDDKVVVQSPAKRHTFGMTCEYGCKLWIRSVRSGSRDRPNPKNIDTSFSLTGNPASVYSESLYSEQHPHSEFSSPSPSLL